MRLSFGFAFLLIGIAFVQSKPLFNNINDLQALAAQYPQYASLINQATSLASQAISAFSENQLNSLGNLVSDLADKVLHGRLSADAAANQLLGAIQAYLGSNSQLFDEIQSFLQQVVSIAQTLTGNFNGQARIAFPSSADLLTLANQFKPSDLQGLLSQFPQLSSLINQITNIADQVSSALSQSQLQSIGGTVLNLAQNVLNGNVDANAAANQLLGELQQYFGSNTQLFNSIASIVQQLLNVGGFGLTRPALSRNLQISDLESLIVQHPQYANIAASLATLANQAIAAFSPAQLKSLENSVLSLAQQVISGQLDASSAGSQLLAQIQQYTGSNIQLYNAIANVVQQLVNLG
ncbi:unnamed protein product [Adineta ricciae]|uniref:Uncharacterized protein n=1 Tax=Adineta ricciae TaxID=249248 RepID=A0A815GIN9_ADIRI|nr:unnamed protein product [Adineta ricciae]CAF1338791.1 unnamed protein product [Adineta ricciae]